MEEKEKNLPQEEKPKTSWQQTKEGWYDKVPLTVRQLDIIIWTAMAALVLVFIKIFMDAGIL